MFILLLGGRNCYGGSTALYELFNKEPYWSSYPRLEEISSFQTNVIISNIVAYEKWDQAGIYLKKKQLYVQFFYIL